MSEAGSQTVARIEFDNGVSLAINEASLPMLIGRGTTTDICVPLGEISREHCELYLEGGVLYVRDSSTNGTRVGNTYLNNGSFVPIEERTSIYLADETRLRVTPVECKSDVTRFRPVEPKPRPQLHVVEDVDDDEERSGVDRRQDHRRKLKNRRNNIVAVEFERRSSRPRRTSDRRVGERRAQF